MKAMFVVYYNDPPEYFEQMEKTITRVVKAGGTFMIKKGFGGRMGQPVRKIPHNEYHFEVENMKDLIDD
jgi:hypothetical protein